MVINNPGTPLIQQGWLRAIIFCAAIILANWLGGTLMITGMATGANVVVLDPETTSLMGLLMAVITGIALSIVFRLFIDRKPLLSLGFEKLGEYRNEPLAGLLLAIVLMGLGA